MYIIRYRHDTQIQYPSHIVTTVEPNSTLNRGNGAAHLSTEKLWRHFFPIQYRRSQFHSFIYTNCSKQLRATSHSALAIEPSSPASKFHRSVHHDDAVYNQNHCAALTKSPSRKNRSGRLGIRTTPSSTVLIVHRLVGYNHNHNSPQSQ